MSSPVRRQDILCSYDQQRFEDTLRNNSDNLYTTIREFLHHNPQIVAHHVFNYAAIIFQRNKMITPPHHSLETDIATFSECSSIDTLTVSPSSYHLEEEDDQETTSIQSPQKRDQDPSPVDTFSSSYQVFTLTKCQKNSLKRWFNSLQNIDLAMAAFLKQHNSLSPVSKIYAKIFLKELKNNPCKISRTPLAQTNTEFLNQFRISALVDLYNYYGDIQNSMNEFIEIYQYEIDSFTIVNNIYRTLALWSQCDKNRTDLILPTGMQKISWLQNDTIQMISTANQAVVNFKPIKEGAQFNSLNDSESRAHFTCSHILHKTIRNRIKPASIKKIYRKRLSVPPSSISHESTPLPSNQSHEQSAHNTPTWSSTIISANASVYSTSFPTLHINKTRTKPSTNSSRGLATPYFTQYTRVILAKLIQYFNRDYDQAKQLFIKLYPTLIEKIDTVASEIFSTPHQNDLLEDSLKTDRFTPALKNQLLQLIQHFNGNTTQATQLFTKMYPRLTMKQINFVASRIIPSLSTQDIPSSTPSTHSLSSLLDHKEEMSTEMNTTKPAEVTSNESDSLWRELQDLFPIPTNGSILNIDTLI